MSNEENVAETRFKVLVIEDDDGTAIIMTSRLKMLGYDPVMARTEPQLSSILENGDHQFFAAFVDQRLWGSDRGGIDLISQLRASHPDVPIVVYTASDVEFGREAMEKGAFFYLPKRVSDSPHELATVLDAVMYVWRIGRDSEIEKGPLQRLYDENPEEVMVRDRNYNVVIQNKAADEAFGRLRVGIPCYRFYENKDKPCQGCIVDRVFKTGGAAEGIWGQDEPRVLSNGKKAVFLIVANPIRDGAGELKYAVEIAVNITLEYLVQQIGLALAEMEHESEDKVYRLVCDMFEDYRYFDRMRCYVISEGHEDRAARCVAAYGKYPRNVLGEVVGLESWMLPDMAMKAGRPVVVDGETYVQAVPQDLANRIDLARYCIAIPIILSGTLAGFITVDNKTTGKSASAMDVEHLDTLSRQVSLATRNLRLTRQLRQEKDDAEWIAEVQRALTKARDPKTMFDEVLTLAKQRFQLDTAMIFVNDPKANLARPISSSSHDERCLLLKEGHLSGEGVNGRALRTGQVQTIEDAEKDPDFNAFWENRERVKNSCTGCARKAASFVSIPLFKGETATGVIALRYWKSHAFSERDRKLFRQFGMAVSVALAAVELRHKLDAALFEEQEKRTVTSVAVGLVHMFRNSSQAILSACQNVKMSLTTDKDLESINRAINAAKEIGDVVALFERYAQKRSQELVPVDISKVVDLVFDLYRARFEAAHIVNKLEAASRPPLGLSNFTHLTIVLGALVENSIEAMQEKGGSLTVVLAYDAKNEKLCVEVTDTGKGIPPDVLEDILQPFVTWGKPGGLGLGLWSLKNLVESLGGDIEIRSTVDSGTTVIVTLPWREAQKEER